MSESQFGEIGAPARRWIEDDGVHVDVRGLPAPQPMVIVLSMIRAIDEDTVLVVHLDRDPRMLYPELAEVGWAAERVAGEPDEVRLRIAREP